MSLQNSLQTAVKASTAAKGKIDQAEASYNELLGLVVANKKSTDDNEQTLKLTT